MKKIFFYISIFVIVLACNNNSNRSFTFTYSVNLESSNGEKLELWFPVPQTNEVQTISNLVIDTQGLSYEIKDEEKHGNKYVYIYSKNGTMSSKTVTMMFDAIRYEHQNVKYTSISPENYLNPSSMVPTGRVFSNIIKDNNLNNNNIRGLYEFVLSRMHYGKPKSTDSEYYSSPWLNANDKYGMKSVSRDAVVNLYKKAKKTKSNYTFGNGNSIYACDIGVGNCTDYHSYFMSLSRTMNIPARFHMGFLIPYNKKGKVDGYHCWADYYNLNEGWYPVDISEADKDSNRIDYFFGTVCKNRLEMIVGRDFKLEGYEDNPVNLFIYPLLEISDKESDVSKKFFTYKNH